MTSRRNRNALTLATQSAQLAFAVPQVVAHRLARMAAAGAKPSQRDRKEFELMGAEKMAAFSESWNAMALQTVRANQQLAAACLHSIWSPWTSGKPAAHAVAQWQDAALDVIGKGLTPVHRKATANAKRLGRIRRS